MTVTRLLIGAALAASIATAANARSDGPSLRDRQQAACYGDVQKFCGSSMPDVGRVTACMKTKKSVVSAKCRALWDVK